MTPDELVIIADKSTSMKAVLNESGYDIWKVPLQIACPVHKLGQETRLSASTKTIGRSGVSTVWSSIRPRRSGRR